MQIFLKYSLYRKTTTKNKPKRHGLQIEVFKNGYFLIRQIQVLKLGILNST